MVRSSSWDNRLIFGDNLLALRALEQEFAGKIKCISEAGTLFDRGVAFGESGGAMWTWYVSQTSRCVWDGQGHLVAPTMAELWAAVEEKAGPKFLPQWGRGSDQGTPRATRRPAW